MKKHILFSFLLFLAFFAFSQDKLKDPVKPKEVESELKKVTVFLNGAQATRTAKVTLPKGSFQIKFINLPTRINSKSIQVKGEGDFSILSQTNQLNIPDPPPADEAFAKMVEAAQEKAKEEISQLKESIAVENNLLAVYQKEETLLLSNQNFGTEKNGIRVEDLRAAADLFRTRLMDITQLKQAILDKIKGYQKQIEVINADFNTLAKPPKKEIKLPDPTTEVLVTVTAKAAVTGTFTITYLVINAGWLPAYDIKVADVSSPVQLTYKANVFQSSDEDWKNIELTLSTGNPNKNNVKPSLSPWKLNYYTPTVSNYGDNAPGGVRTLTGRIMGTNGEVLIGATIIAKGTTVGTFTDESGNFSLTIPAGATSIVVNYLGYLTQERPIAGTSMNIALQEEQVTLEEVIVDSYDEDLSMSDSEISMDKVQITAHGISEESKSLRNAVQGVNVQKRRNYRVQRERQVKEKAETQTIPLIINRVERATNVEFTIEEPYDIPNNGKRYSVDMKIHELPAQYQYYCAPKLDLNAYLTAQITDWEKLNLLEGESNIYFEETFIGKTLIDVRSTEDTLTVSLGADAAIVVSRTKQKNFSKQTFIGGKHIETRAWEIEVRNQKKDAIQLVIEDQYPVSDNAEIEVELLESKGAEKNIDTGILTWDLKLGAGKSKTLGLKYEVKFPKGRAIRLE